jgi:hypothetical protein
MIIFLSKKISLQLRLDNLLFATTIKNSYVFWYFWIPIFGKQYNPVAGLIRTDNPHHRVLIIPYLGCLFWGTWSSEKITSQRQTL